MTRKGWRKTALLATVLGLALLLRLIALRTRGIWYDDAFSIFLVRQDVARIVAGTAADTMPPLYYLLLHLWIKLGTDLVTLRLANVLVSLAIVTLVYRMADSLFGPPTAAWAALLTAVSPLQIYHAQELRMYGLLCLSLLLYLYFFSRIYLNQSQRAWPAWVGLMTSGALAMYSHNLAVFTLLSANFLLLIKRRWRQLGHLLFAQLGMLLLAAPWLVIVPGQIAKIQRAFWTPRPGLLEVVQTLMVFHTNLPVPSWMIPISLVAAVSSMTLIAYELIRRWRRDPGVQLLSTFALFPALLILVLSYLMRPLFVPRGLILSSIAYYTLEARVGAGQRHHLLRAFLLLIFIIPALIALPAQYTFAEFPRSPYESAARYLRGRIHPDDVVLHDNKLSYFPMHYYGPVLPQTFLPDEPGSHNDTFAPASQDAMEIWPAENLSAATTGASRLWFVVFTRAVEEHVAMGLPTHPVLTALEEDWRQVDHVVFNDLEIFLFERREGGE